MNSTRPARIASALLMLPMVAAVAGGPSAMSGAALSTASRDVACASAASAAWPQFRYGPSHTGSNPAGTCITKANAHTLRLVWHVGSDGTYSDPVVANGQVFLTTRAQGRCNGIEALSTATGHVVWRHHLNAFACPDPVVSAGRVILLQRNPDLVIAWNTRTGVQQWRRPLKPAMWSSLTVAAGTLYLDSRRGQILAMNGTDGVQLWTMWLKAHLADFTPAISGGRLYATSETGMAYAIAIRGVDRGHLLWSVQTSGSAMMGEVATEAVSDGRLLVGCPSGRVYAILLKNHALEWQARQAYFNTDLATDGSRVFATSGPNGPHGSGSSVFALSAPTGRTVWSFSTGFVGEKPAVAKGVVFVSNDGVGTASKLFALDAETGKQIWSARGAGSYPSYPALTGTRVYVSNYAFGLPS